jgi:carbon monoxide dehydrogenase subunit G
MDLEGTYTLQASPEDVWKCLMDQQVLRCALPGVEHLEALGENRYAIRLAIKHAPLRGTYQGTVTILEQEYPQRYRIEVEGEGRLGPIRGEGLISLERQAGNTIVHYHGVLNAARASHLLPSPLLRGTAKLLIQQFFLSLADQLRVMQPATAESSGGEVGVLEPAEADNTSWTVSASSAAAGRPDLLRALVRRLHLGGGDPQGEERWVRGIRRAVALTMLLLLIWVGTRLPRR